MTHDEYQKEMDALLPEVEPEDENDLTPLHELATQPKSPNGLRSLLSTSTAQYGREIKLYGLTKVPYEDKETGETRWVMVKKIIGHKLIRRVARNDHKGYFILYFLEGGEKVITEKEMMKHTVIAHKENAEIISKRFRDIEAFYNKHCIDDPLTEVMQNITAAQ